MKEVQIHDKTFLELIPEAEIQSRVQALAQLLNADYAGRPPLVVAVLNGSFLFAADLVRHLDWDPEIQFIRVSSYGKEMASSGRLRVLLDLEAPVKGRDILLVEDIVDTGRTLEWLRTYLLSKEARTVALTTLLYKKEAFQAVTEPEYIGFSIENKFVVGYGMDYAEHGRSLRSVFQLKS